MTLKKQHEWSSSMKNNFKWHKEQINGKWYSVCDHEHVPMIEHTKDDKYIKENLTLGFLYFIMCVNLMTIKIIRCKRGFKWKTFTTEERN